MPTTSLDTLVSIADQRARRRQSDLEQHREKASRLRHRYLRLAAYARDYRDGAPVFQGPKELQSRQRFLKRIDAHVVALANELRVMERGDELLRNEARDDRSCAHALLALRARAEDAAMRRANQRATLQMSDMLATRASTGFGRPRARGAW